jgi:hypothetical protein
LGPALSPGLLWERNFKPSFFSLLVNKVQKPVFQSSFSLLLAKRGWADDLLDTFLLAPSQSAVVMSAPHRKVARMICFEEVGHLDHVPAVVFSASPFFCCC